MAAYFAAIYVPSLASRRFWITKYFILATDCVLRWTLMKHQPCARKARVRSTYNYNLFLSWTFKSSNLFHCLVITFFFQEIIRSYHRFLLFRCITKGWKPIEELWMYNLLPTVCKNDIFSSKINGFFGVWNPYLRRPYILEKDFTSSCRCIIITAQNHKISFLNFDQAIAILHQLYTFCFMHRIEYFTCAFLIAKKLINVEK